MISTSRYICPGRRRKNTFSFVYSIYVLDTWQVGLCLVPRFTAEPGLAEWPSATTEGVREATDGGRTLAAWPAAGGHTAHSRTGLPVTSKSRALL